MSLLQRTNQLWKILIFCIVGAIGGSVIVFQGRLYSPLGEDFTILLVGLSTFLMVVTFVWASLSIKCPECNLRLFWHAVKKEKCGNWFTTLVSQEACPSCGYNANLFHEPPR